MISCNALTHLRQELASRSFVLGGGLDVVAVFLGVVVVLVSVPFNPVPDVVLVEGDDDDSVAMIYIGKYVRSYVNVL